MQDGEDVVIKSRSHAQMIVEKAGSAPSGALHTFSTSLKRKVSWKCLLPIGSVIALLVLSTAFLLHRRQPTALD